MSESRYSVVKNDQGEYSIWKADTELPAGWFTVGFEGSKQECLHHIGVMWHGLSPNRGAAVRGTTENTE